MKSLCVKCNVRSYESIEDADRLRDKPLDFNEVT